MVLNLTEKLRVTEAGIRQSADDDCLENRAGTTAGQSIVRIFAFFVVRNFEGKRDFIMNIY